MKTPKANFTYKEFIQKVNSTSRDSGLKTKQKNTASMKTLAPFNDKEYLAQHFRNNNEHQQQYVVPGSVRSSLKSGKAERANHGQQTTLITTPSNQMTKSSSRSKLKLSYTNQQNRHPYQQISRNVDVNRFIENQCLQNGDKFQLFRDDCKGNINKFTTPSQQSQKVSVSNLDQDQDQQKFQYFESQSKKSGKKIKLKFSKKKQALAEHAHGNNTERIIAQVYERQKPSFYPQQNLAQKIVNQQSKYFMKAGKAKNHSNEYPLTQRCTKTQKFYQNIKNQQRRQHSPVPTSTSVSKHTKSITANRSSHSLNKQENKSKGKTLNKSVTPRTQKNYSPKNRRSKTPPSPCASHAMNKKSQQHLYNSFINKVTQVLIQITKISQKQTTSAKNSKNTSKPAGQQLMDQLLRHRISYIEYLETLKELKMIKESYQPYCHDQRQAGQVDLVKQMWEQLVMGNDINHFVIVLAIVMKVAPIDSRKSGYSSTAEVEQKKNQYFYLQRKYERFRFTRLELNRAKTFTDQDSKIYYNYPFKPQISKKSQSLAAMRTLPDQKGRSGPKKYKINASSKNESSIQQQLSLSTIQSPQNCNFQRMATNCSVNTEFDQTFYNPTERQNVNKRQMPHRQKSVSPLGSQRSEKLYQMGREKSLQKKIDKSTVDYEFQRNVDELTFKPKILLKRKKKHKQSINLSESSFQEQYWGKSTYDQPSQSMIVSQQNAISRMIRARVERQVKKQIIERGLPKNQKVVERLTQKKYKELIQEQQANSLSRIANAKSNKNSKKIRTQASRVTQCQQQSRLRYQCETPPQQRSEAATANRRKTTMTDQDFDKYDEQMRESFQIQNELLSWQNFQGEKNCSLFDRKSELESKLQSAQPQQNSKILKSQQKTEQKLQEQHIQPSQSQQNKNLNEQKQKAELSQTQHCRLNFADQQQIQEFKKSGQQLSEQTADIVAVALPPESLSQDNPDTILNPDEYFILTIEIEQDQSQQLLLQRNATIQQMNSQAQKFVLKHGNKFLDFLRTSQKNGGTVKK